MPYIFFVQDEWYVFGTFFSSGIKAIWSGIVFSRLGHFVPLGKILNYAVFSAFGLNSFPYNVLAIVIHSINAFLVFLISGKLISNKFWRLIPPLVFLSSYIGYEQVGWPMVGLNAFSLSLLLIAWYAAFDIKKKDILKICVIPLLLVFATLILESALPMFIFIPGFIIATNRKKIKQSIKVIAPILMVLVIYLAFRSVSLSHLVDNAQSAKGLKISELAYRVATKPIEYVAQSFIPQPFYLKLSSGITELFFPIVANHSLFSETRVFPVVAFVFGFLLLLMILYISRKSHMFLVCLCFILIFSTPFLFVPGAAGNFSIFPSRYLYQGSVGSSLIFGLIGFYLLQKNRPLERIYFLLIVFVVATGLWLNFTTNKRFYQEGQLRWSILSRINKLYPTLPQKVIFFTESDRSYYGLPSEEHILPFQSGFGQTLLIWQTQFERLPKGFYQDRFLWEISDQGYKEVDGRGFGYFRNFDLMFKIIQEYKLEKESVFAYRFNSSSNTLIDITQEVRGEIGAEMIKFK